MLLGHLEHVAINSALYYYILIIFNPKITSKLFEFNQSNPYKIAFCKLCKIHPISLNGESQKASQSGMIMESLHDPVLQFQIYGMHPLLSIYSFPGIGSGGE